MIYSGYILVPHDTYFMWKNNTLDNGYDVDGSYGCQCWDFASIFWYNVGFPQGYPLTSVNHSAYECWEVNREINKGDKFDLIYDVTLIKQGDVIVTWDGNPSSAGHITFADEDYNGTNYIKCLGQNQGGTPAPIGGEIVNVSNLSMSNFRGAFRYKGWHTEPRPTREKGQFPWHLIAKKLRNARI